MAARIVTFKVKLGPDMRRFTEDAAIVDCAQVVDKVSALFSLTRSSFTLRFEDEEGDLITLASEEDLQEALTIFAPIEGRSIIRLQVTNQTKEVKQSTEEPEREPQEEPSMEEPAVEELAKEPAMEHVEEFAAVEKVLRAAAEERTKWGSEILDKRWRECKMLNDVPLDLIGYEEALLRLQLKLDEICAAEASSDAAKEQLRAMRKSAVKDIQLTLEDIDRCKQWWMLQMKEYAKAKAESESVAHSLAGALAELRVQEDTAETDEQNLNTAASTEVDHEGPWTTVGDKASVHTNRKGQPKAGEVEPDAAGNEQTLAGALAELGLEEKDLSASMLSEIDASRLSEIEGSLGKPAPVPVGDAEVKAAAGIFLDTVACGMQMVAAAFAGGSADYPGQQPAAVPEAVSEIEPMPEMVSQAAAAMGLASGDLSASMCAEIGSALAEASCQEEAAKAAAEAEAELVPRAEADAAHKAERARVEAQAEAEAAARAEAEAAYEAEAARVAAEAEAEAARAAAAAAPACPEIEQLMAMGFEWVSASYALAEAQGDINQALTILVEQTEPMIEETEPVWVKNWDSLLADLAEMGFEDQVAARAAVISANGVLKMAIRELVHAERQKRKDLM